MRVGIVGNGFIAAIHAEILISLGLEIVIVVGTNIPRLKSFSRKWKIPKYSTDYKDVLAGDIDVIHICTPPMLHYDMVKEALNKNKHVICEKPLSIDPNKARELLELAEEKKLVNGVNYNIRFYDACTKIRRDVTSAQFGDIHLIHGNYLQEFHALPADYSWRYDERIAGPMRATSEIGSHWIDLARYLTGLEIVKVSANYGKFNPTRYLKDKIMYRSKEADSNSIYVDSDDCAIVSLRFSNGAIGNMVLSEVSHGRNNKLSIEISGNENSVWWDTESPNRIQRASKFSGVNTEINAFAGGFSDTFRSFFLEAYKDVSRGASSDSPTYPTFRDGYINSKVCYAIYKSANDNSLWKKV